MIFHLHQRPTRSPASTRAKPTRWRCSLTGFCFKQLDLARTRITDAGLEQLEELKGLVELNLANTGISDGAISVLLQMPELKRLNLTGSQVSNEGIERLQRAFSVEH